MLAKSQEFRPLSMNVAEFATTAGQGKSLRMTEMDFRSRWELLPDPPAALESRIGMMVVAAELLCMINGQAPIHEDVARLVQESTATRNPRGVLSQLVTRRRCGSR